MKALLDEHRKRQNGELKETGTPQEKDEEGKTVYDYLTDLLQVIFSFHPHSLITAGIRVSQGRKGR